uniref:Ig-like domain-containing protein n=1 Tax=Oryzias latipes TaxID=8090 RepID=A0A3P9H059_ORYLA
SADFSTTSPMMHWIELFYCISSVILLVTVVLKVQLFSEFVLFSPADISGQTKHLYQRVGDDVLLPCRTKSSSSSCSDVTWLYQKDPNAASISEVKNGNVVQSSARASRLSVSSDCSLLITDITDEDAGRFLCRVESKNEFDAYLNILNSEYSDLNNSVTT